MDIEERAEKWVRDEHGDNDGPFCKEELIAAYLAGSAQTQADYVAQQCTRAVCVRASDGFCDHPRCVVADYG